MWWGNLLFVALNDRTELVPEFLRLVQVLVLWRALVGRSFDVVHGLQVVLIDYVRQEIGSISRFRFLESAEICAAVHC